MAATAAMPTALARTNTTPDAGRMRGMFRIVANKVLMSNDFWGFLEAEFLDPPINRFL